jgi:nucleotide-binding universal stress UspA family protein
MGVIVVGVDGSEPAAQAALTAARLASALGAELRVMSAYGRFEVERIQDDRELSFSTAEDAHLVSDRVVARIRALHPEIEIASQAAAGKPAEALLSVAETVDAELIVVGNKRVQGATRILGSIASEIARKAPCDVYVAHTHARR